MAGLDFPRSYFLLPLSPLPVIVSLSRSLYNDLCIQRFPFFISFLSVVTFFFIIFHPFAHSFFS